MLIGPQHRKKAVCGTLQVMQGIKTEYCAFLIPETICAEHRGQLAALARTSAPQDGHFKVLEIEAEIHTVKNGYYKGS